MNATLVESQSTPESPRNMDASEKKTKPVRLNTKTADLAIRIANALGEETADFLDKILAPALDKFRPLLDEIDAKAKSMFPAPKVDGKKRNGHKGDA
jgi:hypothetical protein